MFPADVQKESGTCNVCSAPCSSCMHRKHGISDSGQREEASSCSFHSGKRGACIDARHVGSEASNLLSSSSSQSSYSGRVESQSVLRPCVAYETSEAVDMPVKFSTSKKVGEDQLFKEKSSHSDLNNSTMNDEQYDECEGDNGSCFSGSRESGILARDRGVGLVKKNISSVRDLKLHNENISTNHHHPKPPSESLLFSGCNKNSKGLQMNMCLEVDERKDSMKGNTCALAAVDVDTGTPKLFNTEVKKAGHVKNDPSPQVHENGKGCSRRAIDVTDEVAKSNKTDERKESNKQDFQTRLHSHSALEAQTADSDTGLIDVNVCDICGDTGREALLATCSRCIDGAEHIYCMRIKLDKVPEGNWICEICEIEENERKKNDKSVSISYNSEGSKKMNLKLESSSRAENSVKLGVKPASSRACDSLKVKPHSFKLGRSVIPAGSIPAVIKELSEKSNCSMVSPNCGRSPLSPHSKPLKNTGMVKLKSTSTNLSPRVQPRNTAQALSRTNSMSSIPVKVQKDQCLPKILSKQVSFDNSKIRPKDKLLLDDQPQKLVRESTSNGTTKGAPVKSMSKSASFKSVNSVSPKSETVNKAWILKSRDALVDKAPSIKSHRTEDQRGLRPIKEKNKIGKKADTSIGRSIVCLSPMARIRPLEVERKSTPVNGKLCSKSGPIVPSSGKSVNDAKHISYKEGKMRNSSSSKSHKSCTSENKIPNTNAIIAAEGAMKTNNNRLKSDIEKVPVKTATKTLNAGTLHVDDKTKDTTACSPKKAFSPCNQELHIHSGKDATQTTRFCNQKPSDSLNLAEGKKKSRLKDAFRTAIQKNKLNKDSRLLGQPEECTVASDNMSLNEASVSSLDLSCQRSLPRKDDCKGQQELTSSESKMEVDLEMKQAKQSVEASCLSKLANMVAAVANSSELNTNLLQHVPAQPPVTCNATASIIPQHEFIWQGAFEILRKGTPPELVDGIQAHLSSFVSPKVLEVVSHIPAKIQLEEVPRVTLWPVQFQESSPTEESIALYFFAKDVHSYERSYQKILDSILRNDLAFRGIINDIELLIFPSNMLPDNSQRWNMLFFLWGVFRARVEDSSRPRSNFPEEQYTSKLSKELCSQPICKMSAIQKIDSDHDTDNGNLRSDETLGSWPVEKNSADVVKLVKVAEIANEPEVHSGPLSKSLNTCNNFEGQEVSSYQEETRAKEMSVKSEAVVEDRILDSDKLIWPLKPNLKRSLSCLYAPDVKASNFCTESGSSHEKQIYEEDDKKFKRVKSFDYKYEASDHSMGWYTSSKVLPLFGNVIEQTQREDAYSENPTSEYPNYTQKLRLMDLDILKDNVGNNFGSTHYLAVEDPPKADSPDLELSLGAPKRQSKKAIQPLFLSMADRSQHVSSGVLVDDDEENITLSLASPGTERQETKKSALKTEQRFPDGRFFNTCRVPFGSFAYT